MPYPTEGTPLWSRFLKNNNAGTQGQEDRNRVSQAWVLPPGTERLAPPANASPGCPLPFDWERRRYCAIDVEVSQAPFFSQIVDLLNPFLTTRVAVAHNASFDTGFISAEYARLGFGNPFSEVADSLQLLRMANPNLLSYSLDKAAFVLGIERGRSHRALDDAITCMMLFAYSARTMAGVCP